MSHKVEANGELNIVFNTIDSNYSYAIGLLDNKAATQMNLPIQSHEADYYFETTSDFKNRIYDIVAENNGDLSTKSLGFHDNITELDVYKLYVADEKNPFTDLTILPKYIIGKNITNIRALFELSQITATHDDIFKYIPMLEIADAVFNKNNDLAIVTPNIFEYNPIITSISGLFQLCSKLTTMNNLILNGLKYLTNCDYLFNKSGLSEYNTEIFSANLNLVNMQKCFQNTKITKLPNISKNVYLKNLNYAFAFASITELPSDYFKNNINIEDLSYSFGFNKITEIPEGLFLNLKNLKTLKFAFSETLLTKIPKIEIQSQVYPIDLSSTFQNLSELLEIDNNVFNNLKISDLDYCFHQKKPNEKFLGALPELWLNEEFNSISHTYTFNGLTRASNYSEVPDDWK